MHDSKNKLLRANVFSKTIKVLFLVFALILAYLFALNGRYVKEDDEYYFDKWTKTILVIENYEVVKQK